MAQIFFISSQYVKENSIVDENVDEKYIRVAIQNAQKNQLIYIIGSGLYNEIAGQIQNNTLTALNLTLLNDYIVPCLTNYTLVELSPYMLYKLSNRNVGVKDAERVTATEFAMGVAGGKENTCHTPAFSNAVARVDLRVVTATGISQPSHSVISDLLTKD